MQHLYLKLTRRLLASFAATGVGVPGAGAAAVPARAGSRAVARPRDNKSLLDRPAARLGLGRASGGNKNKNKKKSASSRSSEQKETKTTSTNTSDKNAKPFGSNKQHHLHPPTPFGGLGTGATAASVAAAPILRTMVCMPVHNREGYVRFLADVLGGKGGGDDGQGHHLLPDDVDVRNDLYVFDDSSTDFSLNDLQRWFGVSKRQVIHAEDLLTETEKRFLALLPDNEQHTAVMSGRLRADLTQHLMMRFFLRPENSAFGAFLILDSDMVPARGFGVALQSILRSWREDNNEGDHDGLSKGTSEKLETAEKTEDESRMGGGGTEARNRIKLLSLFNPTHRLRWHRPLGDLLSGAANTPALELKESTGGAGLVVTRKRAAELMPLVEGELARRFAQNDVDHFLFDWQFNQRVKDKKWEFAAPKRSLLLHIGMSGQNVGFNYDPEGGGGVQTQGFPLEEQDAFVQAGVAFYLHERRPPSEVFVFPSPQ